MNLTLLNGAILAYFASMLAYGFYLVSRRGPAGLAGGMLLVAGCLLHGGVIAVRWYRAGRPPFVTLLEVVLFFSWCAVAAYIVLEAVYRNRRVGMLVALVALLSLGYGSLIDRTISPLVPALQSSWLTIHVATCFVGYASFAVSYLLALVYLAGSRGINRKFGTYLLSLSLLALAALAVWKHFELGSTGLVLAVMTGAILGGAALISAVILLIWPKAGTASFPGERPVYGAVAFGYPFLTIGIVTGAVWANQAWGRYWGWDAKETSSLVTWLIYTVYLHGSRVLGWKAERAAWIVVGGFAAVLFTWLGVNYVLSGLHSYG